jgi:hypothetical protein
MNKTHFFCLILSTLLFSCIKKESRLPRTTSGKINTISVIIDDQLWNGEIGDSIRNKFASPVIGLPEEEPLFTINQYPVKLLEGYNTASRAIIIVKKVAKTNFEIKKNQFASPQNVFHISGKSAAAILALLDQFSPQMIEIMEQGEIAESQRINKHYLLNTSRIGQKLNIQVQVPESYQYVLQKPNFIWLKKEITSGNSSLLIYQLPLTSINKNKPVESIIKSRDSIGKYIHGTEPNTPMVTEEDYAPYFNTIQLDGKLTYETKGTWQLQNDFMSGPFINYTLVDESNNRIVVLEGFCYSPSKEKRDIMHELEAIIKSVRIKKPKFRPNKK